MKIQPGKYMAKIKDYAVVENKSGAPQVRVVFSLPSGDSISWFGGLSTEQQQAITTRTLFTMGASSATIEKVENGPSGGALDTGKEYELVIEDNEYQGKVNSRIRFVNDPTQAPKGMTAAQKGSLSSLKGMAASMIAKGEITDKKPAAPDAGF